MANRDPSKFKSTFKEKKVMKKSIVIFVVFCFCFWSGFLLAQNPDPTHIIGNPGDDEIVLYPTGVYNSGTKAVCLIPTPSPQVGDTIEIFDGYQTVSFEFVDEALAAVDPADNLLPAAAEAPFNLSSNACINMAQYCYLNNVKVIPTRNALSSMIWDFVHREFGEHPNGVAYVETDFGGEVKYYFANGVDPAGGVKTGDGPNIQWAIDNVADGGTVLLKAGTFNLGMENSSSLSKETLFIGTTFPGYGAPMEIRDGITLEGKGMEETVLMGGGGIVLNPDADMNKVIEVSNYLNHPLTLEERDRCYPNVIRDLCIDDAKVIGIEVLGAETFEAERIKIVHVSPGDFSQRSNALVVYGEIGGRFSADEELPKQVANAFISDSILSSTTSFVSGSDWGLWVEGISGILEVAHNEVAAYKLGAFFDSLTGGDIHHNSFSSIALNCLVIGFSSDVMVRSNYLYNDSVYFEILNFQNHYMTYKGNTLTGSPSVGIRFIDSNENVFQGNNLDQLTPSLADAQMFGTSNYNTLKGGGDATVIDNGMDNTYSGNWTILP